MLTLAVLLHLLPLQTPDKDPGIRCYSSAMRIGYDHLPLGDTTLASTIMNAEVFLDRRTSKPVAYLYETRNGAYIQFAKSANLHERTIWTLNAPIAGNTTVPLNDVQIVETQRQLLMNGFVLVGCLSHPINMSE